MGSVSFVIGALFSLINPNVVPAHDDSSSEIQGRGRVVGDVCRFEGL